MTRKLFIGLLQYLLVALLAAMGKATTTASSAPRHDNGLGIIIPYENPFMYNVGAVVAGSIVRDDSGKLATNIQFQPFRAFELYTEQLLFCGNRAEDFRGMSGPIVLTYKRVAHEAVGGVACHELEAVTKIDLPKDIE